MRAFTSEAHEPDSLGAVFAMTTPLPGLPKDAAAAAAKARKERPLEDFGIPKIFVNLAMSPYM
jgi:hypothetical protein